MNNASEVGIMFPRILIPSERANNRRWPVLACNQFPCDGYYWDKTAKAAGTDSTLHITIPHIYLEEFDAETLVSGACKTMVEYIENGVLGRLPKGMIVVDRKTPYSRRIGVVVAVDLEQFDPDPAKKSLIRCSMQTKPSHLSISLRKKAALECPHIVLMINDPENKVIGEAFRARANHTKLYDIDLMMDAGNIKGWFIDDEDAMDELANSLLELKHNSPDNMLFVVGEGNDELASAKQVWEDAKRNMTPEEMQTSPLRYALVEITNICDKHAVIEPVHIALQNVDTAMVLRELVGTLNARGLQARQIKTHGAKVLKETDITTIHFRSMTSRGRIEIKSLDLSLLMATLTSVLSSLSSNLPRMSVSHVYDSEELGYICEEPSTLGLILPPIKKESLFTSILEQGILPKGAFSLGKPEDKRYHLECRLLIDPNDY